MRQSLATWQHLRAVILKAPYHALKTIETVLVRTTCEGSGTTRCVRQILALICRKCLALVLHQQFTSRRLVTEVEPSRSAYQKRFFCKLVGEPGARGFTIDQSQREIGAIVEVGYSKEI